MMQKVRGNEIGKVNNNWYIWVACINCGKERWILQRKTTYPQYTGLCALCSIKKIRADATRDRHPNWKNGIMMTRGYAYVLNPTHPKANAKGYVKRSHLVLEEKLGRAILDGFCPHHLDSIKNDDHPQNLIEINKEQHTSLHAVQKKLMGKARLFGIKEVVDFIDSNYVLTDMPPTSTAPPTIEFKYIQVKAPKWQTKLKEWGL